jgi:hypothetical protein
MSINVEIIGGSVMVQHSVEEPGMAAGKHHAKLVVFDLFGRCKRARRD